MTFKDIMERLGLEREDMTTSMLKLCAPKCQILLKEDKKSPKFRDDEVIQLNYQFTNNSMKITVLPQSSAASMASGKGQAASNADVDNEVAKERSHVIDAVTVRIMKSRKTERYTELLTAVIKQITMFQGDPKMIKKRIEALMEREYLMRDENDKNIIIYKP